MLDEHKLESTFDEAPDPLCGGELLLVPSLLLLGRIERLRLDRHRLLLLRAGPIHRVALGQLLDGRPLGRRCSRRPAR